MILAKIGNYEQKISIMKKKKVLGTEDIYISKMTEQKKRGKYKERYWELQKTKRRETRTQKLKLDSGKYKLTGYGTNGLRIKENWKNRFFRKGRKGK